MKRLRAALEEKATQLSRVKAYALGQTQSLLNTNENKANAKGKSTKGKNAKGKGEQ